jgi:hypothetical protein|tara:strand:+ start:107 stop:619 length:513 start_codon:yes stop_codon:yes gene_type:complete
MPVDHLNIVERKLIDNLRTGTYNTAAGTSTAWTSSDVTVFGQFPTTDQTKYPCIITEMVANGIEQQFMGQNISFGTDEKKGELYGVGFNIYLMVDRDCSITIDGEPYKERRLINYLMLNSANVLMDCNFSATNTEVVERHFSGFRDIGYNPDLETWNAMASMVIVFKNNR